MKNWRTISRAVFIFQEFFFTYFSMSLACNFSLCTTTCQFLIQKLKFKLLKEFEMRKKPYMSQIPFNSDKNSYISVFWANKSIFRKDSQNLKYVRTLKSMFHILIFLSRNFDRVTCCNISMERKAQHLSNKILLTQIQPQMDKLHQF